MNFLENLSQGLRGAGAIMDEGVYKTQRQEENLAQKLAEERKNLQAQLIIRAAETGAVDPQAAQAQLKALGIQAPVGPDAATQQRQEEIKRRDAISRAMAGLAPEERQNPLKIADVFLTNGDPATGAKYIELAEQRQSRREQVLGQLAQRQMELEQRAEDKNLDREQRAALAAQSNALKAQLAEGQRQSEREGRALRALIAQSRPQAQPPQPQIVQTDQGPVQVDRSGNAVPIMVNGQRAGPARSATDHLTEQEAKGTLFYRQMKSANDEIDKVVGQNFDTSKLGSQVAARMANSDWTNWLAPEKAQRYAQSTEQWAEAYLRLKTGAATNSGEIKRNARAFFPQPGDSAEVIEQKNRMRRQAESDVSVVAGRGLKQTGQASSGASGGWSIKEKGK
jgi:hypothetical protein